MCGLRMCLVGSFAVLSAASNNLTNNFSLCLGLARGKRFRRTPEKSKV